MVMAADRKIQTEVVAILKSLPDTENTRVHTQIAQIGLALPGDLASELVPLVEGGLKKPYQFLLSHRAVELAKHLALDKKVDGANRLVRSAFELLPDPTPPKQVGDHTFPPTPRTRIQGNLYDHQLDSVAPQLIDADPVAASMTLADLLGEAWKHSTREGADETVSYSRVGWSDLAVPPEHLLHDPKGVLLRKLVGAVTTVGTSDTRRVPDVVRDLMSRSRAVFKRVALHLLSEFPEAAPGLADQYAQDLSLMEDPETLPEYRRLLYERFPKLEQSAKEPILAWVRADESEESRRAALEQWLERAPSSDELTDDSKRRRLRRLRVLAGSLPADLQEEYQQLSTKFDEPVTRTIRPIDWGIRSPKTAEELLAMNDDELIAYLKAADLGHDLIGPSMEGLGDAAMAATAQAPERIARMADQFVGVDPLIVSGVLRGIEGVVRGKAELPWPAILRLCQWVVDQPRAIPGRKTRYSDLDPGWVWTRRQIASLLLQGIDHVSCAIPFDLRGNVWPILAELAEDPDPAEDRDDDDPAGVAINSVRGEAIHGVIAFALWVRREDKAEPTLEQMPEVRAVLDRHLDHNIEKSAAIRSVYSQFLPHLLFLDQHWTKKAIPRIFSDDPEQARLREAAWVTYLRFHRPSPDLYILLEGEYRSAVAALASAGPMSEKPESAERRLAEHLMILAWSGAIPIDGSGVFGEFFRLAPPDLRAHAIESIGLALINTEEEVQSEIRDHIRAIWAQRLSRASSTEDSGAHKAEAGAFGWWFVSGKFEDEWSLDQLLAALNLAGEVDRAHSVYERLADLTPEHPLKAMQCLDRLVQPGTRPGWSLDLGSDHISRALSAARGSDDEAAKRLALEIINRLSAHGFPQFLRLIR